MGAAFEKFFPADAGPKSEPEIWTLPPAGVIYIVGRTIPRPNKKPEIHIQGASLTEAGAEAMVVDETYFIAPIPLDILLPEKPLPWYGLRFPLRSKKK